MRLAIVIALLSTLALPTALSMNGEKPKKDDASKKRRGSWKFSNLWGSSDKEEGSEAPIKSAKVAYPDVGSYIKAMSEAFQEGVQKGYASENSPMPSPRPSVQAPRSIVQAPVNQSPKGSLSPKGSAASPVVKKKKKKKKPLTKDMRKELKIKEELKKLEQEYPDLSSDSDNDSGDESDGLIEEFDNVSDVSAEEATEMVARRKADQLAKRTNVEQIEDDNMMNGDDAAQQLEEPVMYGPHETWYLKRKRELNAMLQGRNAFKAGVQAAMSEGTTDEGNGEDIISNGEDIIIATQSGDNYTPSQVTSAKAIARQLKRRQMKKRTAATRLANFHRSRKAKQVRRNLMMEKEASKRTAAASNVAAKMARQAYAATVSFREGFESAMRRHQQSEEDKEELSKEDKEESSEEDKEQHDLPATPRLMEQRAGAKALSPRSGSKALSPPSGSSIEAEVSDPFEYFTGKHKFPFGKCSTVKCKPAEGETKITKVNHLNGKCFESIQYAMEFNGQSIQEPGNTYFCRRTAGTDEDCDCKISNTESAQALLTEVIDEERANKQVVEDQKRQVREMDLEAKKDYAENSWMNAQVPLYQKERSWPGMLNDYGNAVKQTLRLGKCSRVRCAPTDVKMLKQRVHMKHGKCMETMIYESENKQMYKVCSRKSSNDYHPDSVEDLCKCTEPKEYDAIAFMNSDRPHMQQLLNEAKAEQESMITSLEIRKANEQQAKKEALEFAAKQMKQYQDNDATHSFEKFTKPFYDPYRSGKQALKDYARFFKKGTSVGKCAQARCLPAANIGDEFEVTEVGRGHYEGGQCHEVFAYMKKEDIGSDVAPQTKYCVRKPHPRFNRKAFDAGEDCDCIGDGDKVAFKKRKADEYISAKQKKLEQEEANWKKRKEEHKQKLAQKLKDAEEKSREAARRREAAFDKQRLAQAKQLADQKVYADGDWNRANVNYYEPQRSFTQAFKDLQTAFKNSFRSGRCGTPKCGHAHFYSIKSQRAVAFQGKCFENIVGTLGEKQTEDEHYVCKRVSDKKTTIPFYSDGTERIQSEDDAEPTYALKQKYAPRCDCEKVENARRLLERASGSSSGASGGSSARL